MGTGCPKTVVRRGPGGTEEGNVQEAQGSERLDRRTFVGSVVLAAAGLGLGLRAGAQERSVVVLARAGDLVGAGHAPQYQGVLDLLTAGLRALTGEPTDTGARQRFFGALDSVAVQIAAGPTAVAPEVVDALCTVAARAGVETARMFVYSADEHELHQAGFAIRREGPGVRCYGASSEGYRDSLTTLLASGVTAIANVPCLSPHPQVGLAGAIANYLNAASNGLRHDALAEGGARLPAILKLPACGERTRVHVMDCLRPGYDVPEGGQAARWAYNGLLLSADPVALDAVALAILQAKRREVAGRDWPLDPYPLYIRRAAESYGLGVADLAAIDLVRVGPMEDALV